ncbi:MAG TPA: TolC family protein, partial [Bacteroidales bacterium]|nr:TolC family protein [Bacteroidales bacterium]
GMSGNARIRKAKVEIMKSHQDRQQMEQALAMGYSNARIQLDKNLQTIVSQRKNMDLAREVFEITHSNYSEGISSLSDLLNTSASLIQAQMNYVNALNNCMKAYIDLKRADGTINELNL